MPRSLLFVNALLLSLLYLPGSARQAQTKVPQQVENIDPFPTVEVLSDTHGADLNPYIRSAIGLIYKNWTALLPGEVKPPQSKQGESVIRIRILPDGRIGAMWLDSSTHDDAINRACWQAVTRLEQFPPLPDAMGSNPLLLRIHFYVNTQPH
jgi:TonB family protein